MYNYQKERGVLFTEEGAEKLEQVRRNVRKALKLAGAVRAQETWNGVGGDSWALMACTDYLVEKGELTALEQPNTAAQHRVFVAGRNHWDGS